MMTFEAGSVITQILLSAGAILIGILATRAALRISREQRAADHQRWIDEQVISAYVDFHRVFMEMQSFKRRKRRIALSVLLDWQSATSALELFGSVAVRRQVDVVWEVADSIRAGSPDGEKWKRMLREIESLRALMRIDLRLAPKGDVTARDSSRRPS